LIPFLSQKSFYLCRAASIIAVEWHQKLSIVHKLFTLLIILVVFLSFGCEDESQFDIDRGIIRDHLEANNIEAEATQAGLYYRILDEGGNVQPTLTNVVEVRYRGTFLDGVVFDETEGNATVEIPLAGVIEGWQRGLSRIGRGGKIELWIPSYMAYGARGRSPSIPPNTVLYFDIDLVDFE
jgi:FKBP-type peptidyl-prolyl cis-trans isomerase